MRKEFIDKTELKAGELRRGGLTYTAIVRLVPWAVAISPADGGFWAFESIDDFDTWQRQV